MGAENPAHIGIDTRTVQPVASSYTDYANRHTCISGVRIIQEGNTDFIPKHHQLANVCNGDAVYFLEDKVWYLNII
jgi:hypothetical protein